MKYMPCPHAAIQISRLSPLQNKICARDSLSVRSYDEAASEIEMHETYRAEQHAGASAQGINGQLAAKRYLPSEQGGIGPNEFVFFPQRF